MRAVRARTTTALARMNVPVNSKRERQLEHGAGKAHETFEIVRVETLLQREPLLQRDRAPERGGEDRGDRHVAQPAELDQQHDHDQAEGEKTFGVSTTMRPVTHTAEVAVNSASM